MGFPIKKLPTGPINRNDTARILRSTNTALEDLQRAYADNSGARASPNLVRPPGLLCITMDSGPNDEADYTDARYWVRAQLPSPWGNTKNQTGKAEYDKFGIGTDLIETYDDPESTLRSVWFTATNLHELAPDWSQNGSSDTNPTPSNGTHRLPPGSLVRVDAWPDPWNHSNKWYTFEKPLPIIQAVLTGKATTNGVYTGNPISGPPATPPPAAQVSAYTQSQLCSVDSTTTYYFYNRTEAGRSGSEPVQWDLMYAIGLGATVLVTGTYLCVRDDGFVLWQIDSINFKNCGQ